MTLLRQLRAPLALGLVLAAAGLSPAAAQSQSLPTAQTGSPASTVAAGKGRAVLQEAIAALGGDLYLQARYRSASGRAYGFTSTGDLESTGTLYWMFTRFPDAQRVELTKKRDVIELISGDKGWEITYKGVAPMLATQLADSLAVRSHSLDVVLKQWAADPSTLVLYQGLNEVDGTQVDSVAFYHQNSDEVTVDFDLESHLPLRSHWRRDDPLTGGHFDESTVYGNWTSIGGIATAMATSRFQGDHKVSQQYLDTASYAPLADSLFEPAPLKH